MKKATYKPPSRVRYDQSHPVVSCRFNRDIHTLLSNGLRTRGYLLPFIEQDCTLRKEEELFLVTKDAQEFQKVQAIKVEQWWCWYQ